MEEVDYLKSEKKSNAIQQIFEMAEMPKTMLKISCLSAVIGYLSGIIPYLSVFFISKIFLLAPKNADFEMKVVFWIIIAGVGLLCNMIFSFLGHYGCHYVAFKLMYAFRLKIMEHMGNLSMQFFTKKTTGSIQKTMDESIDGIEGFIGHMLPDIAGSLAVLIVLIASVFLLNVWLALAIIVSVFVALGMQMLVFGGEKSKQIWADVAQANQKMTGAFSEYVRGIAEVKIFGKIGVLTNGLNLNIENYKKWELKQYKKARIPMGMYKSIILSMLTFVMPVSLILMEKQPSPAVYLAVLMALILTPCIYDPLMTCITYGTQMSTLAVGLDNIQEILSHKALPVINPMEKPDFFDVRFENVDFAYPTDSGMEGSFALKKINFIAEQGKMTALVGESGSGKSTIGQLIARFWEVASGQITIGNIPIERMAYSDLMDTIAFVLQDTYLFSDTIFNNITMNCEYEREAVIAASKAAQCHDFIMRLGQGYDTRIGSDGIRLSGGEMQRLSIARAILKNAPVVILDEALAYSDAENENLIQEAIHNLMMHKTVIVIAHRLQSIMNADQVILLHQGQIIERGNHKKLMDENTRYKLLWDLQHEADEWALTIENIEEGEIV